MACEVTSTAQQRQVPIVTDYVTDPARDAVVMQVRLPAADAELQLYVRLDASVNGNGGGGTDNGGADDATVDPATTALVPSDTNTVTNAVNRDYARADRRCALRADRPFLAASAAASPARPATGWPSSTPTHRLGPTYRRRRAATSCRPRRSTPGTARSRSRSASAAPTRAAVGIAGASAAASPCAARRDGRRYAAGWRALRRRPAPAAGRALRDAYYLSANVLKASEDKTFPGAVVASLASPWGQAVSAGDTPGGQAGLLRLLPRGVRPRPVRVVHRRCWPPVTCDRPGHRAVPVRAPAAGRRPVPAQLAGQRPDRPRTPAATSSTRPRTRS